jgi:hypothetical protein
VEPNSQDTAEPESAAVEPTESPATEPAKPERSGIKWPYTDVDDAVTIASTIKSQRGNASKLAELAADLGGSSTKSGGFRTKLATASTFGAVQNKQGTVALTDLGHRLADEHTRPAAMVEAFLNVPLYKTLYERYYGKSLPGDTGLNSDIRQLGVVASQVDRARQVMQRSAEKAGLFYSGRTRLVIPPTAKLNESAGETDPKPNDLDPGGGGGISGMSNPLLSALFSKMLPPEGHPFPADERRRLFRALAVNLDVIYGDQEVFTDASKLAEVFKDTKSAP